MAVFNVNEPYETATGLIADDEPFYYQNGHQFTRFGNCLTEPDMEEPTLPPAEAKTKPAKPKKVVDAKPLAEEVAEAEVEQPTDELDLD